MEPTHVQFLGTPDQAAKLNAQCLEIKMHVQLFTRQFAEVKACKKIQLHSLTADVLCHYNIE